jgi:hypothetical protein
VDSSCFLEYSSNCVHADRANLRTRHVRGNVFYCDRPYTASCKLSFVAFLPANFFPGAVIDFDRFETLVSQTYTGLVPVELEFKNYKLVAVTRNPISSICMTDTHGDKSITFPLDANALYRKFWSCARNDLDNRKPFQQFSSKD